MKPLYKGDTGRVRLHTGEVVDAVYDTPAFSGPHHFVLYGGRALQTVGLTEDLGKGNYFENCRFVGNPCVLVPVVVSV